MLQAGFLMKTGTEHNNKLCEGLRSSREELGLSLDAMAAKLGVHKNTLAAYERGERLPDIDFLMTFSQVTQNDFYELLKERVGASPSQGRDQALKYLRVIDDTVEAAVLEHRLESPRPGYVYLPLYDVHASAGNGHQVDHETVVDSLAFKEDWIRQELRARPADLNLIYVEGDSMEPDLRAGDIVLLDHTDTRASREGVYVIRMDGALLVKQLQRLPGGVVKVISRNAAYESFTVTMAMVEEPNGFAVIGRVVWACRRF